MTERIQGVTNGFTEGVSPKAVAAALAPFVAGLVLMILDLIGVIDVDDSLWIGLLGISPVAGGAAAAGKTGTVVTRKRKRR